MRKDSCQTWPEAAPRPKTGSTFETTASPPQKTKVPSQPVEIPPTTQRACDSHVAAQPAHAAVTCPVKMTQALHIRGTAGQHHATSQQASLLLFGNRWPLMEDLPDASSSSAFPD